MRLLYGILLILIFNVSAYSQIGQLTGKSHRELANNPTSSTRLDTLIMHGYVIDSLIISVFDSIIAIGNIGEANTISDVAGTGVGLAGSKVGVDLRINRIYGTTPVVVSDSTDSVRFSFDIGALPLVTIAVTDTIIIKDVTDGALKKGVANDLIGTAGWVDDGTVVRLTTVGDSVGIGTASPAVKIDINGDFAIRSSTLSQWTTNQNNLDRGGFGVLRVSSDANRTLSGVAGGQDGLLLTLFNIGSDTITIGHQDANSDAANRFLLGSASDFTLLAGFAVSFQYDGTSSRWRDYSTSVDNSGLGDISNGGNTTGANIRIGTDDAFDLEFETNNTLQMTYDHSDDELKITGNVSAPNTGSGKALFGGGTSSMAGNNSAGLGEDIDVPSGNAVVIGYSTYGAGTNNVVVGFDASGGGSSANGENIVIGASSSVGLSSENVVIGQNVDVVQGSNHIAIGHDFDTDTWANNSLVISHNNNGIQNVIIGEGNTHASPPTVTYRLTNGLGTNIAGGDMIFTGSRSTGTGEGGNVVFNTSPSTTAGSSLNASAEALRINDEGIVETPNDSLTLAASATTIAATSNIMTITGDAGTNTIATITGVTTTAGTLILIFVDANVTITDDNAHTSNSVDLNAAFTSADDTVLMLVYNGVSWYEINRSVN
jgi:hypothetical protein